jgi:carboxymethylenebutenolidase
MRFLVLLLAALVCDVLVARAQDDTSANGDVRQVEAAPSKPVGHMVYLSDFGAEDLAYLSIPNTPPTMGIVLVPDAFGLDDFTKGEADRLAGMGYLALAVDIYNGHQTTDPGDLANLTANLDNAGVMKTITAGIRLFHESPKFRVDHVVAIGWGTGASFVLEAARDNANLDGAVTFYGPVLTGNFGHFEAPLCALYPDPDPIDTPSAVLAFEQAMKNAGNDFEGWTIEAPAGWSNPKSKGYNPVEDKEAWKVVLPFLVRISSTTPKPKDDSIIDKAKTSIQDLFK